MTGLRWLLLVVLLAALRLARTLEKVFLDTGETLSASSVAAVHGNRLLIGGSYEPRLLDCRLP